MTEPTAEHVNAVASLFSTDDDRCGQPAWTNRYVGERIAALILSTTDPAAQAALADNLPDEVLLDVLARRGTLPAAHIAWEYGVEHRKAYNNFEPTIEWGASTGMSHRYEYTESSVHALAGGNPVWRRRRTTYGTVLGDPERVTP